MTDVTKSIPQAVDAALALRKEHTQNKKLLDETVRVFIQVTLHKTPVVEEPVRVYMYLDHCQAGNNPDLCVFTKNAWPNDDITRTSDDKIEYSIDYYDKVFQEHKIEGVSAIMPLRQLRHEYGPYELKRKLVNRFDLFLADRALTKKLKFTHALGKEFAKTNKFPVGVKFPKPGQHDDNFKNRIEKALKTAYFRIKPNSNNYSIPVGVTSHTRQQLIENTTQVVKQLFNRSRVIPGGSGNIKSIYLKTDRSPAVPLYISLESKNNIPVPYVHSSRPKREDVEGEISTRPGVRVIVTADGDVIIKKKDKEGGEDGSDVSDFEEGDEEEEEEDYEADSDVDVSAKKESEIKNEMEKSKTKQKDEDESEDEDDVAENAEQKYLSNWLDEMEEGEEENKESEGKQKNAKGRKRKLEEDSKTDEKETKIVKNSDKVAPIKGKRLSKPQKKKIETTSKNVSKQLNLPRNQRGSPKLEKRRNKGKNFTGKRKKPMQLSKKKSKV